MNISSIYLPSISEDVLEYKYVQYYKQKVLKQGVILNKFNNPVTKVQVLSREQKKPFMNKEQWWIDGVH